MKKTLIIIGSILIIIVIALIILYNVMFISKDEVKNIVLEHANITENDIKRWNVELGMENGNWEYDVEYIYNNEEYNYEIDAKTGEIIIYGIDK